MVSFKTRNLTEVLLYYCLLLLSCVTQYTSISDAFILLPNTNTSPRHHGADHYFSGKMKYGIHSSKPLQAVSINHEELFKDLDVMYTGANKSIKCPFIKRRAADSIDNLAMVLKFLIIRHKSLLNDIPIELLEVPGCKAVGLRNADGSVCKYKNLPIDEICTIIENDWSIKNNKGYYITGRLNSTIYRDDCFFDGPDPDMPVRGLRKYLAAASQLFEAKNSFAKLYKIGIVGNEKGKFGHGVIESHWQLGGVLMLPWRPKVKPWSGWTRYHLNEDGLIAFHEEGWDISVLEAFIGTLFPEIGDKIWEREVVLL